MIDFACRTVDLRTVIACSFALTAADLLVLDVLMESKKMHTSESIESRTKLERSSVQRSLKRLTAQSLCERRQENIAGGGYRFQYSGISRAELARRVLASIDGFRNRVGEAITTQESLGLGKAASRVKKR